MVLMPTLDDEISDSLGKTSLSKGDDLLGFQIDISYALNAHWQFKKSKQAGPMMSDARL
jgi:hypothetical protein